MRTTALIALLPFLATAITARPHQTESGHDHSLHSHSYRTRKSLSFGPTHSHASFNAVEDHEQPLVTRALVVDADLDVKSVAKAFISHRVGGDEGEAFYIRDDTYTDANTGVTHIYARQIINGLEVSDGDINLNIDRDGRVISWGNSFHPGAVPNFTDLPSGPSGETERTCSILSDQLEMHKAQLAEIKGGEGAWGLVKSAAQVFLGGSHAPKEVDEHAAKKAHKSIRHVKHHLDAVCNQDVKVASEGILSPVEALVTLLPRLSTVAEGLRPIVSETDFSSTPHHSLKAKAAPAEPPTEIISGPGLDKSGVVNHVPARLMYTQISEGAPRLVWKFEVEMKDNWYEAYVDVKSGELLRVVDWASDYDFESHEHGHGEVEAKKGGKQKPLPSPKEPKPYKYNVFKWGVNDPSVGNVTIETDPWDTVASPLGWHKFPTSSNPWDHKIPGETTEGNYTVFDTTAGNNVIAHEDWEGRNNFLLNYRPVSNASHSFIYDYGEVDGLAPREYIDMVATQLFYTSNMYHDLLYRLGFDEISGNFQAYNFGLGGKGGDPVITNAQDGSGYNNANFMTPPDGTAPRMRMYIWDTATPYRDGDLEAGIVIHEYSHGLSTRLTGGPANSGCLGYGEAGGMGEGWGDFYGTIIRQIEEHSSFKNNTDSYGMGQWAANRAAGIRNYVYSTNSTVNPSTYKTLDRYYGVHAIGEVWAQILFVVSQEMIEEYGFSKTLFPPSNTTEANDYYTKTSQESVDSFGRPVPLIPKHGNTLLAQLVVDGMKLQPCRPSFFDARDAIIQADQIRTGGANACLLWKAFAERGLGHDAELVETTPWGGGVRRNGFGLPKKVCKSDV